jgi:hypothetical protein
LRTYRRFYCLKAEIRRRFGEIARAMTLPEQHCIDCVGPVKPMPRLRPDNDGIYKSLGKT